MYGLFLSELSKLLDRGLSTIASLSFDEEFEEHIMLAGYIFLLSSSVTSWITGPLFVTLPGDEGYKR